MDWKYTKEGRLHKFFDEEYPMAVYIIKLGTEDGHGYGVITDDPHGGSFEPCRMMREGIRERFGIEIPE